MGGPKHAGQMYDDTLDRKFDPLDARINVAVPKAKYLETASVITEEVTVMLEEGGHYAIKFLRDRPIA